MTLLAVVKASASVAVSSFDGCAGTYDTASGTQDRSAAELLRQCYTSTYRFLLIHPSNFTAAYNILQLNIHLLQMETKRHFHWDKYTSFTFHFPHPLLCKYVCHDQLPSGVRTEP